MTRQEKEDQAQLEWLQKWKERRKEKRNVRKKPLFYKILRKLGIIKDYEEVIRTRMEMCERAIKANVCPEDCGICAWDTKGGIDYNGYITTSSYKIIGIRSDDGVLFLSPKPGPLVQW